MKCLFCGAETKNPKFCNPSCAARFNNQAFPKRKRKQYYCKSCGAETGYRRSYCKNCDPTKPQGYSRVTIAETRSRALYQANAWIRNHARRIYDTSDKPKCCNVCGYSKHFEVCHIRSIQDFPESTPISVVNNLQSLVALYPNCHWEFDQGILTL
jgi:hypothetical protein